MKSYMFAGLLAFVSTFSFDATIESDIDTQRIQEIVDYHVANHHFSGVVLVADQGDVIYEKAFGTAYVKAADDIQTDYRFSIASVAKMFAAVIVLQLVEEKKLSLDDNIAALLPQLDVPNGENITIHHLLLHISGLPNEKTAVYTQDLSLEETILACWKNRSSSQLNTFNYNNVDYKLLGLVIEKLTGNSWEEALKARILQPLGMQNTGLLEYGYYPERFAYTYQVGKKGKLKQDPFFMIENAAAAADMYATAADLLKFDQALYDETLLSEEMRRKMAISYPEYQYVGYGVWNYQYPFLASKPRIMERRGKIMGANVVLVRLIDENKTIIILSNNDAFNPDSFGDDKNLREQLIRAIGSDS